MIDDRVAESHAEAKRPEKPNGLDSGGADETSDCVTILTVRPPLVATKRIKLRQGQAPEIRDFDQPKFFSAFERRVNGLDGLTALLAKIEQQPRAMVIRGELLPDADPRRVRRLLYARHGETDGQPNFCDMPRRWVLFDFDALDCPADVDPCRDAAACVRIAASLLPAAFHGVSCWWQFTSGAGIKPGIRLRLGYWLSRALGTAELKRWIPGKPIDQSVFSPVQAIHVARPIFEEGNDPVPVRSGIWRGTSEISLLHLFVDLKDYTSVFAWLDCDITVHRVAPARPTRPKSSAATKAIPKRKLVDMVENLLQILPECEVTDEEYLNQAKAEIRRHGKLVVSSIFAIGKKLAEVKNRVGHGRYGQFIRDRLRFSERSAQQFVQSYEFIKSAHCADFESLQIDPSALRLLVRSSTPEGVRIEALA